MDKTSLNQEEIAERNPNVDLELLERAQREMKSLGIKPARYNLENAFSRRSAVLAHE